MARLPNLRSLFGRARDTAPAPVAEITADRHAASVELLEAQRAAEVAQAAFDAGLLDPAADRRALDDARRDAGLRLDAAKALCVAFSEKAVAAQAAERQAELARIIADADAAQAAFRDQVVNDLPLVGTALRGILRGWAEAELARQAANSAIAAAEAGAPRPGVEAFRASGGRPERILRTEQAELWTDAHGNAAANQDKIRLQSDGTGSIHNSGATYNRKYSHRRSFEIVEILEVERHVIPDLLARTISIPGLTAFDNAGWVPLSDPTPERVLAALDHLERHIEPSVDTRQPRKVTRPIGPVREVAKVDRTPMIGLHQSM